MATLIFLGTYILISLGENSPRKLDRPTAALLGAVLMLVTGTLTRRQAASVIDFQTLAVLFGMMVLLALLMQSGLPVRAAYRVLDRCKTPEALMAVIVLGAGATSALLLNDTVCLLATPLILEITEQAHIKPIPYLLALATGANIGSATTLTGNPQNIIIGHASGWGWSAFALRMVPIGLVCLLVDLGILLLCFRQTFKEARASWMQPQDPAVPVDWQLARKTVIVFAGLIVAFLVGAPLDMASVAAATLLLVWANRPPKLALQAVDWSLLLFFAGLFIVVGGFAKADSGILSAIGAQVGTQISATSIITSTWATIIGSNLFSNVPFVLIAAHWIVKMENPSFMWALLALVSTLSGNLTLFGSVANLIVAQGAQSRTRIGFMDFLRAGVPVTLATTAIGVLMLSIFLRLGWM